ncbi:hypothetical protein DPEC_G00017850 [Dallia pectoralis]|uniref:Uncharacterized protein n=1 Tax=Dallia pectoralis TaxID=75939 RepID=A0ACC2HF70_DALPE|nr:hypothetical protein DPEC_G00017850 [Dallia pectoralis]
MQEMGTKLEEKCDKTRVVGIIREQLNKHQKKGTLSWAEVVENGEPKENHVAFNKVLTELDERKSRERNIVLFGIKESEGDQREERQQLDVDAVKDVFKMCRARTTVDSFVRVSRLGKYSRSEGAEEPAKLGRPVLVTLQSMELKISLFRKILALHQTDKHRNVRLANDLTKTEREKEKELYEEAKEKQRKSPGEYTFRVRGPPWARREVRIPKTK